MSEKELSDSEETCSDRSSRSMTRMFNKLVELIKQTKIDLTQSIAESIRQTEERLTQSNVNLEERLRQSNEESISKLTELVEKYKAEMQENLTGLTNRLDVHIRESREEKTRMHNDIIKLTERVDNINLAITEEIEKNNVFLCNEIKDKTDEVHNNLMESVKEVSTRTVELSLKENPDLVSLVQRVDKTDTEIDNVKRLVTEIRNDLDTVKDTLNERESTCIESDRNDNPELLNRVSSTEIQLQEPTRQLSEETNNRNITGNETTNNTVRDDTRVVFVNSGNNNAENCSAANKNEAMSSLQTKSSQIISPNEWLE